MKKIRSFLIGIILMNISYCFTQSSANYAGGATVYSLAGITASHENIQASYHNPAATSYFDKSIGFDVSIDSRYLNNYFNSSLAVIKRIDRSRIGIGIYQNGISEYKETNLFLLYARPLFKNLSIGTRLNYNNISIREYGKSNLITIDFGMHSKINKSITLSAYFDAITSSKISDTYKKDNKITVSFSYHPSLKMSIITEFEKNESDPLSPKLGLVYSPNKNIQFQTGVDLQREIFGFGFKYNLQSFNFTAGQSIHSALGNIFALSISGQK